MTGLAEGVRWYATLLAIGWGLAPLSRWLCGRLPDRGATLAKPLALLAVVWPTWFLASLTPVPFTTAGLWVTLAIGAAIGWGLSWRAGWVDREWLRSLLIAEIVTLAAFAAYVGLRGYTPQITWTEKPMDVAFLSASARATDVPPTDPWYAGEGINYYYLGYFLHGSLARMADVPSWIAFNLALATTVALTLTAAAGLGFNVARRRLGRGLSLVAAAGAAFLVVLAGNLRAPIELVRDGWGLVQESWWIRIGWESSRIVVDPPPRAAETINEFPWFSFLLGDLHPHVTALPFTVTALALAVNLLASRADRDAAGQRRWSDLGQVAVAGAVIGALYPLNSWDFPTYLVLAGAAILLAWGWTRAGRERLATLVVAAIVPWLPFTLTFAPPAGGNVSDLPEPLRDLPVISRLLTIVAPYDSERTSAGEFLTVFGIFWAIGVVYLAAETVQEARTMESLRLPGSFIVAAIIVLILAVALPAPALVLAGAPLVAAGWLLWRRWGHEEIAGSRTVAIGCYGAAFALILITEFFFIQDHFHNRMNTLFKVYYQAWTLLAVGSALAAVMLWQAWASRLALRGLLAAGLTLGVVAGMAYPVAATIQWTRVHGPRDWQGLDGLAYLRQFSPGDEAAIRWLADNAREGDVVLEAPGCSYQVNGEVPTGRIAAFTGVPTLMGWEGSHERLWRSAQSDLLAAISMRVEDVPRMYDDPQSPLFDQYGVTLLYIGHFERTGAGSACPVAGPFDAVTRADYPGAGWELIWQSEDGQAQLYRRVADS
ncbi:MAG TPA: DUF2298 domain-containing protein [Thermomicrobiales bacterium]